ncbi:conserved hypothetical protein [Gluconacetobacter diazotrophicus PA1 5]|uniref:DUF2721 domain-containing protein n=2 Tax=Gluconacetobacter diazotrophicus TaxID=33996 RepID=A0A7W4FCV9_GLUDI|nr:DUF2721 domain-containing protein [Gluconacetobacter diazotrophicus]ACI51645.1 conserved hypothetical protein [Gluconacetobacter diazotrophicus PA1 5]MBB2155322.1 DUF2721 domain-containing protein [Gluconacetobacter diazotrophicus]TWB10989.1 uncharacterized protein DUF2721 [Gluconacetobacter diazotrophicus]CAP55114.1 putative membrane protein [Gluconacetobacter diazotrophicus PA1 5]
MSPFPGLLPDEPVDTVAHLIQTALTPIFMLSGIGTLLNLFNTRLARVSDHIEKANETLEQTKTPSERRHLHRHLGHLHRRTLLLDAAILLGAVGGASACGAAFVLFLGSLRDSSVASWLVVMFGVALCCTVGALAMFLCDSLLAWHGLRMTTSWARSIKPKI